MSKRSLIIIIVMLAVVNVLAGLYYLGARMESEGRSLELTDNDTNVTVQADTMPIVTVPDTFDEWTTHRRTYVSTDSDSETMLRRVSTLSVRMRLPRSVNGNDSLAALRRALARAAFGGDPLSISEAVSGFLAVPRWGTAVVNNYSAGTSATVATGANTIVITTTVTIEPRMTSQRLLVIAAERTEAMPGDTTTTTAYVHYDRLTQHVLDRGDILLPQAERKLLSLINEKIAVLNSEKHLELDAASRVPQSFRAQRTGLLFCYKKGELTSPKHGSIDVLVSYKVLGPCLTPKFKNLLWHNADYRNL